MSLAKTWAETRALITKDARLEWRSRDILAPLITVSLLVAMLANVAFDDIATAAAAAVLSGTVWIAIVFGAQVGLARTFVVERDEGTLSAMLSTPVDPRAIFASKLVVNLTTLALVAGAATIAAGIFFNVPPSALRPTHLVVLFLASMGIGLVTTFAATLAMHGRHWVLLVPLLALPALFPVLAAAVPASTLLLEGVPVAAITPHLRVLFAYDIVLVAASWVLVPFLLEP